MDKNSINTPKVSVIIPVYNTGLYVKEAVLSVIDQTLTDIEILIIDDGSSDNSLQIVEKLAAMDNRVVVFSQTNQGQSVARNVGLELARGEYVYFMDSDDLLDKNALYSCYNKCIQEQLDIVFFNAEIFSTSRELSLGYDYNKTRYLKPGIYRGVDVLLQMLITTTYRASVCLNLIRLDFLNDIRLRFYPGIIHEDELFSAILYMQASRVSFLPEIYYKRRIRENSTMTNVFTMKNVVGYLTVLENIKAFPQGEDKAVKQAKVQLLIQIVNAVIYRVAFLPLALRMKVLCRCFQIGCFKYIRCKNKWILFFPVLIKLKSLIK